VLLPAAAVRGRSRREQVTTQERVGDELGEEGGGVGHDRGVGRRRPGHLVALRLRVRGDGDGFVLS
jgi:hypothetical protein